MNSITFNQDFIQQTYTLEQFWNALLPSKLVMRVRFPLPAPAALPLESGLALAPRGWRARAPLRSTGNGTQASASA